MQTEEPNLLLPAVLQVLRGTLAIITFAHSSCYPLGCGSAKQEALAVSSLLGDKVAALLETSQSGLRK